jgi:hypothetical protein
MDASLSTPSTSRRLPCSTPLVSAVLPPLRPSRARSRPPSTAVKSLPSSVCPSATVGMCHAVKRVPHRHARCAQVPCASWAAAAVVGHIGIVQWAVGTVAQAGRVGTVQLGRAQIRSSGIRIVFLFSEYIQILANSKFCVGFISTQKIMKQILLDRS